MHKIILTIFLLVASIGYSQTEHRAFETQSTFVYKKNYFNTVKMPVQLGSFKLTPSVGHFSNILPEVFYEEITLAYHPSKTTFVGFSVKDVYNTANAKTRDPEPMLYARATLYKGSYGAIDMYGDATLHSDEKPVYTGSIEYSAGKMATGMFYSETKAIGAFASYNLNWFYLFASVSDTYRIGLVLK